MRDGFIIYIILFLIDEINLYREHHFPASGHEGFIY